MADFYLASTPFPASTMKKRTPILLDELAISNVVRYTKEFEPRWKGGKRPEYAYGGAPELIKRFPIHEQEPILAAGMTRPVTGDLVPFAFGNDRQIFFDSADGFLKKTIIGKKSIKSQTGGFLLWEGADRKPLFAAKRAWVRALGHGRMEIHQYYDYNLELVSSLENRKGTIHWNVKIKNYSPKTRLIEALLSLPIPMDGVDEIYDGLYHHTKTSFARRNEEYIFSLPYMACVKDGMFVGVGLDPHCWESSMVKEYVPVSGGSVIRDGVKLVIDPGDTYELNFVLLAGDAPFGFRNALERYYYTFPDLFLVRRDIAPHANLPIGIVVTSWAPMWDYCAERARKIYCGHSWIFHPTYWYSDALGRERYWKAALESGDPQFANAKKNIEKIYKTLENFKKRQKERFIFAYNNFYTIHAYHWDPQLKAEYIVKDIYPAALNDTSGDRLYSGHTYKFAGNRYFVNHYNTALGAYTRESIIELTKVWKHNNIGFVNDIVYYGMHRLTDPIARKTRKGRSFSNDRGIHLLFAFGVAQTFQDVHAQPYRKNYHLAAIADGGYTHYTTSTIADKSVQEWKQIHGSKFEVMRYISGEKPLETLSTKVKKTEIFNVLPGERLINSSEAEVRKFFRNYLRQYFLLCLEHGVMVGNQQVETGVQFLYNTRPIVVEGQMNGFRVVPGARVNNDLFVVRYGHGLDSMLVLANRRAKKQTTDVTVDMRAFNGRAFVFGDYFQAETEQLFNGKSSVIKGIGVEKRDIRAFRALGEIRGDLPAYVKAKSRGDGIKITNTFRFRVNRAVAFELIPFVPQDYEIAQVRINGTAVGKNKLALNLKKGEKLVEIVLKHKVLEFSSETWKRVDLIDPETNQVKFCPFVPQTASEFEFGTAKWLNRFVFVYDYEDNVKGNLKAHKVRRGNGNFAGWKILVGFSAQHERTGVSINEEKKIIAIDGPDEGERRRAMAIFMRLLDRRYPNIGSYLPPLKLRPFERFNNNIRDKKLVVLFKKYNFHKKPLLLSEYEYLYKDGNMNFQNKYKNRTGSYIYEPATW